MTVTFVGGAGRRMITLAAAAVMTPRTMAATMATAAIREM